ncbi:MAG TPA: hypothetical protein DCY40_01860 [Actinobacteria bacterium]|nr:hypothetical protein [Actinomycetota bacterium]
MALPATSADPPDPDRPCLGRLAAQLRQYQVRYGVPEVPPAQRLDDRLRSGRGRLRFIDDQIAELTAERHRLRQELAGFEKGLALVLDDEIDRLRREHGEAWSPVPIRSYRMWQIRDGRMMGARLEWKDPWLTAGCARGNGRTEVPHSDGRCGTPPCGIYTAKHPELLLTGFGVLRVGAMGLVELSGKVVEHARGYRAEHARVVALGLVAGGRWLTTDSPGMVTAAFHDPEQTVVRWGSRYQSHAVAWAVITEYLIAREEPPWTSESNSA